MEKKLFLRDAFQLNCSPIIIVFYFVHVMSGARDVSVRNIDLYECPWYRVRVLCGQQNTLLEIF